MDTEKLLGTALPKFLWLAEANCSDRERKMLFESVLGAVPDYQFQEYDQLEQRVKTWKVTATGLVEVKPCGN